MVEVWIEGLGYVPVNDSGTPECFLQIVGNSGLINAPAAAVNQYRPHGFDMAIQERRRLERESNPIKQPKPGQ